MKRRVKTEQGTSPPSKEQGNAFGIRQLLAEVNLRDFSKMVLGELTLVGSSARLAVGSRRPLTPLILLAALLRVILLALVVVVLGGAILFITVARMFARAVFGRPQASRRPF